MESVYLSLEKKSSCIQNMMASHLVQLDSRNCKSTTKLDLEYHIPQLPVLEKSGSFLNALDYFIKMKPWRKI
jgi:hypothetical protein